MNYQLQGVFRSRRVSSAHRFVVTLSVFLLTVFAANAGWTRIGLEGTRVTAITSGKVWSDTLLFAGTDSGVYSKAKNGSFNPMTSPGSTAMPAGLKHAHSLCMASAQAQLFAGTDSGLYSYHFTSGIPPAWFKISGIYGSVVAIAGLGDTIVAATQLVLYRSVDGGTVWASCTLSFNQNKHPVYTSIAFFWGINAGSDEWLGSAMPWVGVANSMDFGHTWNDISKLPGQALPLKPVYCLATYRAAWNTPLRLIAGTSSGIQWVDDLDTGTWRPLESPLTIAPARDIYVTTYSKSNIAMLFASTDSGIFTSAPKTQSSQWQQTLKKHAYGVTSFVTSDPSEWFAAVEDGVYRYDESTPIRTISGMVLSSRGAAEKTKIVINNGAEMVNTANAALAFYAPNGKKSGSIPAHGVLKHAPFGIVITRIQLR